MASGALPKTGRGKGFTLVEVLVAMAVFAIFMIGILNLLDTSTRISQLEADITDTQENVRFAAYHLLRTARMMGGARMPFARADGGTANWFAGSVDSNLTGAYTSPYPLGAVDVLPGTDVVTIRGFFEIPPFFVSPTDVNGSLNRVVVQESAGGRLINPGMNVIEAGLLAGRGLVLMGRLDQAGEYAVGQVGTSSTLTGTAPNRTLTISMSESAATWWTALNPPGITAPPPFGVFSVGIMDAYTYYVDPDNRLMRLRADNTAGGASRQPVAVNIGGFQVALGIDTTGDGSVDSWQATPTAAGVSGNRVASMRIAVLGRTSVKVSGWQEPAASFAVGQDTQAVTAADRQAKWRRVEVVATLRNFMF